MTHSSPKPVTSAQSPNITSPAIASSLGRPRSKYSPPTPTISPARLRPTTTHLFCGFNTARRRRSSSGDMPRGAERGFRMIAEGLHHLIKAKIGHHGSRTSTMPPFLAAVTPSYALISQVAATHGHPERGAGGTPDLDTFRSLPHRYLANSRSILDGTITAALVARQVTGIKTVARGESSFWFQSASFKLYDRLEAAPILALGSMGRSRCLVGGDSRWPRKATMKFAIRTRQPHQSTREAATAVGREQEEGRKIRLPPLMMDMQMSTPARDPTRLAKSMKLPRWSPTVDAPPRHIPDKNRVGNISSSPVCSASCANDIESSSQSIPLRRRRSQRSWFGG